MLQRAYLTTTDLTSFVINSLTIAAQRVLTDRLTFALDDEARTAWEAINDQAPHDIPGLRALMERPSPFLDE